MFPLAQQISNHGITLRQVFTEVTDAPSNANTLSINNVKKKQQKHKTALS